MDAADQGRNDRGMTIYYRSYHEGDHHDICGSICRCGDHLDQGYREKEKVYDKALKAPAHDSFHRQYRELLSRDTITGDELENLNYLHGAYKSLGPNGTGEELYKRCLEKPIR